MKTVDNSHVMIATFKTHKVHSPSYNFKLCNTMAEISISKEIEYFGDDNNSNFLHYTMYKLMHFYVFKMAVAIASLCINASD